MILVIDNFGSFTFNLVQYLRMLGEDVSVRPHNDLRVRDVKVCLPAGIMISPGPGRPSEAYISFEVIKYLADRIPILGVGFGHQAIVHAFGGEIVRARKTMHGKTSRIQIDGRRLFKGISGSFEAMRYHSHVACRKTLPESLLVTAESEDDHEIMGVRHREYPVEGIQFHPESIMTTVGKRLLRNFLKITRKEWL